MISTLWKKQSDQPPTPPHHKNLWGQNFCFVSALGRAIFREKMRKPTEMWIVTKKCPEISFIVGQAGVSPKVFSRTILCAQFCWPMDLCRIWGGLGARYSFLPGRSTVQICWCTILWNQKNSIYGKFWQSSVNFRNWNLKLGPSGLAVSLLMYPEGRL